MKTPDPKDRVFDSSQVAAFVRKARTSGMKVVLTNGCFDILHRGHIEYLHQSANLGDVLIVAINSDSSVKKLKGPSRPINQELDRAYALSSLRCVDAVFIFSGTRLVPEIRKLKPDIYTKAGDYTLDSLDPLEFQALKEVSADIRILPFVSGYSTSEVINKLT